MLTIIIPTLNEEKYLPRLLASIKSQNFPAKIIIADDNSQDQTPAIARQFNCQVVKGGCPGVGRNAGAKAANSDWLLFLDADVELSPQLLAKSMQEVERRGLSVATCRVVPLSDRLIDKTIYLIGDLVIYLLRRVKPLAHGFCIFIKKSLHDEIGGFDETITFAEDSDYVQRAAKIGWFGVLQTKILVSVRRFDQEGRLSLILKYLYLNLYRFFRGEIRQPIKYEYGRY